MTDTLAKKLVLRVMTWNVWWRFGDWQRRQEAIARVLRETAPDLVGLQEVWGTATENQAHQLAELLGMHHAWAPSPAPEQFQRRINDRTVAVGNAIISRWPIVGEVVCTLPAGNGDTGRMALLALIDAPMGTIPFITTQLSSAVGQSALRCEQVRALTQFISDRTSGRANPILTGDLNAEPDSDEIRLLGGHKTPPAVPGLVLVDLWLYAEAAACPWTWDRRNPAVFATGEPNARIDYIFLAHRTTDDSTLRPRTAWLAGDSPVGAVWPSDHAAVVAELTWSTPAP